MPINVRAQTSEHFGWRSGQTGPSWPQPELTVLLAFGTPATEYGYAGYAVAGE